MTKKVTGKDLEKLLEGVLSEREEFPDYQTDPKELDLRKVNRDTLNARAKQLGSTGRPLDAAAANDYFAVLAKNEPPTDILTVEDVLWYEDRLEKITTKVESILIALSENGIKLGKMTPEEQISDAVAEVEKQKRLLANRLRKNQKTLDKGGQLSDGVKGETATRERALARVEKQLKDVRDKPGFIEDLGKAADAVLKKFYDKVGKLDPDTSSLTSPRITTQSAESGGFPKWQENLIKSMFPSGASLKDRLEELSKISLQFFNATKGADDSEGKKAINELNAMSLEEFSQRTFLLDILNTCVKEMDAGSGAYFFEYFLALLTLGEIKGKETTDAGKMGATDFIYGNNQHGSAKFYSKPGDTKQAKGGFEALYNNGVEEIQFVVAAKKSDVKHMEDKSKGQADPNRIIGLEVYFPKYKISKSGDEPVSLKLGKESVPSTDSDFLIGKSLGSESYPVYIVSARSRTFKEMINKDIKGVLSKKSQFIELVGQFFDSMQKADASSKIYMNTPEEQVSNPKIQKTKSDAAKATQLHINAAKTTFKSIVTAFKEQPTDQVTESQKITAKMLQKLIEENFKK